MKNIYEHREANIAKTWVIMLLFFGVVIGLGWVFARVYGDPSILVIAVVFSTLMSVISYWYSDKIVLAMAKAPPGASRAGSSRARSATSSWGSGGRRPSSTYLIDEPA